MTTSTLTKETCFPQKKTRFHDIDAVIGYLKTHGSKIGEQAKDGLKEANDIIKWYDFLYRAPGDPGAQMLLERAVTAYVESQHS
jgi:hypothetical protein